MSIETNNNTARYVGNGATTVFPFAFKVWDASQVRVFVSEAEFEEREVTQQVNVILSDVGGSVSFATPPAVGVKVALTRSMPFIQEDRYVNGTRFDAAEIEQRFDMDCAERQQIYDTAERAVKVPVTDARSSDEYTAEYWRAYKEALSASSSALDTLAEVREVGETSKAEIARTAADAVADVNATADAVRADVSAKGDDVSQALERFGEEVRTDMQAKCDMATGAILELYKDIIDGASADITKHIVSPDQDPHQYLSGAGTWERDSDIILAHDVAIGGAVSDTASGRGLFSAVTVGDANLAEQQGEYFASATASNVPFAGWLSVRVSGGEVFQTLRSADNRTATRIRSANVWSKWKNTVAFGNGESTVRLVMDTNFDLTDGNGNGISFPKPAITADGWCEVVCGKSHVTAHKGIGDVTTYTATDYGIYTFCVNGGSNNTVWVYVNGHCVLNQYTPSTFGDRFPVVIPCRKGDYFTITNSKFYNSYFATIKVD